MAKRPDNDATMDVSVSQLVPDSPQRPRTPGAAPQGRGGQAPIAPNDMSVWKQVVVSSDDFAPPTKNVRHGGGSRRWVIIGALLVGIGAGGGLFAWRKLASDPAKPAATATAADPAKPGSAEAPLPTPSPVMAAAMATATDPAKPAEPASAAEPAPAAEPAAPTWFDELATQLTREPTWFTELGASFVSALGPASGTAAGKKPAAAGKRTAVRAPAKKPAAPAKKPAATPTKRR